MKRTFLAAACLLSTHCLFADNHAPNNDLQCDPKGYVVTINNPSKKGELPQLAAAFASNGNTFEGIELVYVSDKSQLTIESIDEKYNLTQEKDPVGFLKARSTYTPTRIGIWVDQDHMMASKNPAFFGLEDIDNSSLYESTFRVNKGDDLTSIIDFLKDPSSQYENIKISNNCMVIGLIDLINGEIKDHAASKVLNLK